MSKTLCAAGLLVVLGASNAFATVGGQEYDITIAATVSGVLTARMEFVDAIAPGDAGQVGIDIPGGVGDYTGFYTTGPGSTVVTNYNINSIAPDDGFFSRLSGTAIDFKQGGPLIGGIAQALKLPGVTFGFGFSTSGDLFTYAGVERQ